MTFVLYQPHNKEKDLFHSIYTQHQTGFGYIGRPYQRGGGALGSIFKGLFRSIAPIAKSALKSIGKTALKTAVGVASDAIQGGNVIESVKNRGKEAASDLLEKAVNIATKNQVPDPETPSGANKGQKRKLKPRVGQIKKRKVQRGKGLGKKPGWKTTIIDMQPDDIYQSNSEY